MDVIGCIIIAVIVEKRSEIMRFLTKGTLPYKLLPLVLCLSLLVVPVQGYAAAPVFQDKVQYYNGSNIYKVENSDVNGDGKEDLLVLDLGSNKVSVLLGIGDGTFQGQKDVSVRGNPRGIAVADFNGDGNLDIVVTSANDNMISILLGSGDGNFQLFDSIAVGNWPEDVLATDLNGDGKVDIVTANHASNTLSILQGVGDGTFVAQTSLSVGIYPRSIVAADFNGDGRVDLAAANSGSNTISILLNSGTESGIAFNSISNYGTGISPLALHAADFNSDGKMDVALAANGDHSVNVFLGQGDGTFGSYSSYYLGYYPLNLTLGDFDGDELLDIAGGVQDGNLAILFGNRDGTFQSVWSYPYGSFTARLTSGNFNGDNKADIATANTNKILVMNSVLELTAPTNITLSSAQIVENNAVGLAVGTLSATDSNKGESFTYSLVSGSGDSDNSSFEISGNTLLASASFDYEEQSSYSIRIRVTDSAGLAFEKSFTIVVGDENEAPIDITLSGSSISENAAAGTTVGVLSAKDPDAGESFTYTLVSGAGSTDNSSFQIVNDQLLTYAVFDYEAKNSYEIRVRVTDNGTPALSYEKTFTITVTDVNEAPTDLILSSTTIDENEPIGTTIGFFSALDKDKDETLTYELVSGAGDTDNASFMLDEAELKLNTGLNYKTQSSYSIRASVKDSAGHTLEQEFIISINDVNEAPVGELHIQSEAEIIGTRNITLQLTASDPDGDALDMRFSNDSVTWGAWEPFAAAKAWTLSAPDGDKTVYMQLRDEQGLISTTYEASIKLDTTAPTGTIVIQNGDDLSRHKQIVLTVKTEDAGGIGGVQARFSNDQTNWSEWEAAQSSSYSKDWMLKDGKGTKSVYMQLKDAIDNTSMSLSDTIDYKSLPKLSDVTLSVDNADIVMLSGADFQYSNEDGSALQSIIFITLPDSGTLKLDGTAVIAGQSVDMTDISKLTYTPRSGWKGTTTLEWNGSDGEVDAESSAHITFTVTGSTGSGSSSGSGSTPVQPSTKNVTIIINGIAYEQFATASTTTASNNRTQTTITLDDNKLLAILKTIPNLSTITIPFLEEIDQVSLKLSGSIAANLNLQGITVQLETATASYSIPGRELDGLSSKFGEVSELKDFTINFTITSLSPDSPEAAFQKKKDGNIVFVSPAIDFQLTASYNGKTVEIKQFNGYVERRIAIPAGILLDKITTGVVVKSDGTLAHVPTKIVEQNGHYYAVINSLRNSIYSVIYNDKSFIDVAGHWSKDIVEEMGARLIVGGVDDTHFEPNTAITRAEFTAIIVRALGLREANQSAAFTDVLANGWYYTSVAIAQQYGLIQGYSGSEFGPNQSITRQEAMVIVQRALKLAGLELDLSKEDIDAQLLGFKDSSSVAEWAKAAAALSIKLGIIEGSAELASPERSITRAETAVIMNRMLAAADLIK